MHVANNFKQTDLPRSFLFKHNDKNTRIFIIFEYSKKGHIAEECIAQIILHQNNYFNSEEHPPNIKPIQKNPTTSKQFTRLAGIQSFTYIISGDLNKKIYSCMAAIHLNLRGNDLANTAAKEDSSSPARNMKVHIKKSIKQLLQNF